MKTIVVKFGTILEKIRTLISFLRLDKNHIFIHIFFLQEFDVIISFKNEKPCSYRKF